MNDEQLQEYSNTSDSLIIAPAGCGKTETIVKASNIVEGKQLLLTHTNAGVKSLRDRAKKYNLGYKDVSISTIASLCLMISRSYPKICGYDISEYPQGDEWNTLCLAGCNFLGSKIGKKVIRVSFDGCFVDEYQDCDIFQHRFIRKLAEIIPCRIAGDPLQSIFDFQGNIVEWESDVLSEFSLSGKLDYPWRWEKENANLELGKWIVEARSYLENGEQINLRDTPDSISWFENSRRNRNVGYSIGDGGESVIYLCSSKKVGMAKRRAKDFGGRFNYMERMSFVGLREVCQRLDQTEGYEFAEVIFDLVKNCVSNVTTEYRTIIKRIENQKTDIVKGLRKHKEVADLFQKVIENRSVSHVITAIEIIRDNTECNIHRKELLYLFLEILSEAKNTSEKSLIDIFKGKQQQISKIGREIYYRSISNPLKIKGLEFDHVILELNEDFTKEQFYVSISRPKKSLTILSDSPEISFA